MNAIACDWYTWYRHGHGWRHKYRLPSFPCFIRGQTSTIKHLVNGVWMFSIPQCNAHIHAQHRFPPPQRSGYIKHDHTEIATSHNIISELWSSNRICNCETDINSRLHKLLDYTVSVLDCGGHMQVTCVMGLLTPNLQIIINRKYSG
jgi:hypothetical protein